MTNIIPVSEETIRPQDDRPVPWTEAAEHLAAAGTFWMATVRPDGQPHVRPILAVWVDDALHFVAGTSSRKWANLGRSPRCSLSTGTPGLDLVVEGEARHVTDDARLRRVANAYESKYGWPVEIRDAAFHAEGAPTAGPPPFHIFALSPAMAYAFATDETFADRSTRWRFSWPVRRP